MVFGYNEVVADSFWLRWIQSIDLCGKNTISRQEYEKKLRSLNPKGFDKRREHAIFKGNFENDRKVCDRGWSFRILQAVTHLAPKFTMPFTVGASALSVIVEDHLGAKELLDRGLSLHPENWRIHYYAAYHYLYELYEVEKSASLMLKAAQIGGPSWLYHLASSLYSNAGQVQLGINILKEQLKKVKKEEDKKKILEKLGKLKKALKKH